MDSMKTTESSIYTLKAPYFIELRGKRYPCNLNSYRNTHYRIMNQLKKKFKDLMREQIETLPTMNRVKIHYIIHYENARSYDIDNIVSVVSKFFQDALVELNRLPDDSFNHITKIIGTAGNISRNDGYIEIKIKEL